MADLLWSEWDPIGGGRMPDLPRDEYDAYATPLAAIIKRTASADDVVEYLRSVERDRMGLSTPSAAKLEPIAQRLVEEWNAPPLSTRLIDDPYGLEPRYSRLERFVGRALFDEGIWSSDREEDGVRFIRIVSDGGSFCEIVGELWTIDQTTHVFWIELKHAADGVAWRLFYDLDGSERAKRQAASMLDAAADATWKAALSGHLTPPSPPAGPGVA